MSVKVGSFAKSTSAAPVDQAVTGVGFTPKVLILWCSGATAADTFTDHFFLGYGVTTGAAESGSIAASAEDARTNTNTANRAAEKALTILNYAGTLLAECDLKSFDADGFTLTWTTNNAVAYSVSYMALGGADLTNAKVLPWTLSTSTGDQAVTGVGFTPAFVLHLIAEATSLPASNVGLRFHIGAMTAAAQFVYTVNSGDDESSGSNTGAKYFAANCIRPQLDRPSDDAVGTYVSMDADGFTVNLSDAPATGLRVISLCLKGGSYKIDSFTWAGAAPADQAETGVGFLPEGVFFFAPFTGTSNSNPVLSLSATDGTAEQTQHCSQYISGGTTNIYSYTSTSKVLASAPTNSTTLNAAADIKSLDADGFTITWTTRDIAPATPYIALACGAAAAVYVPRHGFIIYNDPGMV